jgi:Fe-Mn family superoxide dismutase
MNKLSGIEGITDQEIVSIIRESLTLPKKREVQPKVLTEAYVLSNNKYDLATEKLSEENKAAHQELMDGYIKAANEVSAMLDSADREGANPNNSGFRNLKLDEVHNINAAFLHGLFFENISDVRSSIAMDSLTYMRLERDFGSFDAWQRDFIACALASRNGWVVTVYNFLLKRYINVVVDLHNIGIPFSSHPVIVLDCWEHSYYRDYLKDRRSYVFAMMKELRWPLIEERVRRVERMLEAAK